MFQTLFKINNVNAFFNYWYLLGYKNDLDCAQQSAFVEKNRGIYD